ncbi:AAA family ATPase [Streptomyces oryzae]|uniref:AAA family ATPase n=1 Tax=Streptomyces oryzae TaxID=1434886 RepID=A0ABS3XDJ8_9ACTN|nr:AAA family ATPase [Streptomyces oryzae]MBO8193439.1 AAA family ATPase [Streptomyces oryzae]
MGASQHAGGAATIEGPAATGEGSGQGVSAPAVSALHLSAFRSLRALTVPLGPVTVLTGPSGSGKSTVLEAYRALARLGQGHPLDEVFEGPATPPEVPSRYVPQRARPDRQGRRGFRLGCAVTGPAGPLRFDVAVQAEPELRVVGERLSRPEGETLLATALRDPARRSVTATRHVAGTERALRMPFPDDRLTLPLLPLRVAGTTAEDCALLEAVEQVVVALRSVFACDPVPALMREPVAARAGRLRGDCANLADVLRRTRAECTTRHAALLAVVREGCAGPVTELRAEAVGSARGAGPGGSGLVRGVLERGDGAPATPLEWLGEGELRYAALGLVLLTGPGVLSVDTVHELPAARQALTVLADGMDRGLDGRQTAQLLALAGRMARRGHVRLLATGPDGGALAQAAAQTEGVTLIDLGG